MSSLKFVPRRSEERGHAYHGWLKTFHTFSFAGYCDRNHESFGPLRVLNEDRVDAYTGFDTHSHREFEIFSYVVEGALEQDLPLRKSTRHHPRALPPNLGKPWKSGLKPKYYTRHITDEEKLGKWATVVAPHGSEGVSAEREGEGPAPVQSALTMYASIVAPGMQLEKALKGPKAYIHVIQTSGYKTGPASGAAITISNAGEELVLKEGDGAYISVGAGGGVLNVVNSSEGKAEVLLFDLQ